jgi:hypothetical protein
VTRVARHYYYYPVRPVRSRLGDPAPFGHRIECDEKTLGPGTDVHALRVMRRVSVSPLSIDMTSRVNLGAFERLLRGGGPSEGPR